MFLPKTNANPGRVGSPFQSGAFYWLSWWHQNGGLVDVKRSDERFERRSPGWAGVSLWRTYICRRIFRATNADPTNGTVFERHARALRLDDFLRQWIFSLPGLAVYRKGGEVHGTIDHITIIRGKNGTSHLADYHFEDKNRVTHTDSAGLDAVAWTSLREGDRVAIKYLSAAPSVSRLDSSDQDDYDWRGAGTLALVSLGIMIAIVWYIWTHDPGLRAWGRAKE